MTLKKWGIVYCIRKPGFSLPSQSSFMKWQLPVLTVVTPLTSAISRLFSSVPQSCLTLCNPMVCSMPGFPVHHQLLELAQTHVHLVGDAIQPSHPLSSSSSPAFNLSQHQGLFHWVSSFITWPKHWSFSPSISLSNEYSGLISFRIDWFDLFACPRDSQESSPTPQFIYSPWTQWLV